jgi:hypothetical protein
MGMMILGMARQLEEEEEVAVKGREEEEEKEPPRAIPTQVCSSSLERS